MDQSARIFRFCAQHKGPAVVLEQAARCEVAVGALVSCCLLWFVLPEADPCSSGWHRPALVVPADLYFHVRAIKLSSILRYASTSPLCVLLCSLLRGEYHMRRVCCFPSTRNAAFYLCYFPVPPTALTLTPYVMIDSQYDSCDGTPRYGKRDGPLNYCQTHKRAGLYTVRDGVLYVATRDGSGTSLRWTRAPGLACYVLMFLQHFAIPQWHYALTFSFYPALQEGLTHVFAAPHNIV